MADYVYCVKQYKTCYGCIALTDNDTGYGCMLGYSVNALIVEGSSQCVPIPLVPCPRPETCDRYRVCVARATQRAII